MSAATAFEPGLLGRRCWLELATGERVSLPTSRWRAAPEPGDELLLAPCTGPTMDVGCGPGRLTAALAARGVIALGVDVSEVAVRLTREAGAPAIRRDVFDRQPGEGRWQHVLLADGNIGIGGDPTALLRRIRALLRTGGTALVELDPPGRGLLRGPARVTTDEPHDTRWFDWAWVGADAITAVATTAGLTTRWIRESDTRHFAELVRP